ncbi:SDR family NAD(P)-dependent oxidoreductase [Devosia pacifica]|nr:SDR family oxidoreductase [Devosia pacifica]
MDLPVTPSFTLDGKRALVTGASSGIGLAAATALARAGAFVTLAARREDKLRDVVEALAAEGVKAEALVLDIANVGETQSRIAANGPFDILVNSAGTARHAPAADATEADFDAVMETNLKGAFFVTSAVANGLLSQNRPGSLINISSQMGHVGGIDRSVYCASKHAVEGFTKAMAIEWGPAGIRVNTVCPTFLRTPLTEKTFADPARRAWIEERIKLGRAGELSDIMGAVVYLASDASAMVTGTALMVDGGWTAD